MELLAIGNNTGNPVPSESIVIYDSQIQSQFSDLELKPVILFLNTFLYPLYSPILLVDLYIQPITQNAIDKFILERSQEVKRSALNKDIRNLKAFIQWCGKNRYANREIEIRQLKEDERPVKFLNSNQFKKLLSAFKPYQTMRMRTPLALGTGLRRGDIESLKVSDIDFENSYVATRSKKTGRVCAYGLCRFRL